MIESVPNVHACESDDTVLAAVNVADTIALAVKFASNTMFPPPELIVHVFPPISAYVPPPTASIAFGNEARTKFNHVASTTVIRFVNGAAGVRAKDTDTLFLA